MGEEVLVAVIVGMGHTPRVTWNRCRRKSTAKAGNSIQEPGVGVAEAPGRAVLSGVPLFSLQRPLITRHWPLQPITQPCPEEAAARGSRDISGSIPWVVSGRVLKEWW